MTVGVGVGCQEDREFRVMRKKGIAVGALGHVGWEVGNKKSKGPHFQLRVVSLQLQQASGNKFTYFYRLTYRDVIKFLTMVVPGAISNFLSNAHRLLKWRSRSPILPLR